MEARQHRYHLEWEPATGSKNRLRWLMRNSSLPRIDDDICSPRIWTHIGKSLMFVTSVLHKKMIQSNLEIRKNCLFPYWIFFGNSNPGWLKIPTNLNRFWFPFGSFCIYYPLLDNPNYSINTLQDKANIALGSQTIKKIKTSAKCDQKMYTLIWLARRKATISQ